MCRLVYSAIEKGDNLLVLADLRRIAGEEEDSTWSPSSPQEIAQRLFHTAFMGMEKNSSPDTRKRASTLAAAIGSYHLEFDIDTVVSAVQKLFTAVTAFTPRYKMLYVTFWVLNFHL
jgi:NAD+ synthase (glutamine-hydrolysing)